MNRIISKNFLKELYINQQMTDVEIALFLNCNKQTVFNARKHYSLKCIPKFVRLNLTYSSRQKSILFGTIAGDGHITKESKNTENSCIEIKHCLAQQEYLLWKYQELQSLCKSNIKLVSNQGVEQVRLRTFHHPIFTSWRNMFYDSCGKKYLSSNLLNEFDDLSLAVWYMDDGSFNGSFMKIATYDYSYQSHLNIVAWLKSKFNIISLIKQYDYLTLVIHKDSRVRMIEIIKPFIHKSLEYKIEWNK